MEIKIENNYIGYLDTDTFLFSYTEALNFLFNQLKEEKKWGWMQNEYPKSEFTLWVQTGVDEYGHDIYAKLETFKISKLRRLSKLNVRF
jgi:hypothetical protein